MLSYTDSIIHSQHRIEKAPIHKQSEFCSISIIGDVGNAVCWPAFLLCFWRISSSCT